VTSVPLLPLAALAVLLAHDPQELDADWFNSLRGPEEGVSCCGNHHDCATVSDYRPGEIPGSYRALLNGEWLDVPAFVVLERADNPTGLPVLCIGRDHTGRPFARCFVRPSEG